MPVELPRAAVPAQPFAVVEDPDEGEDDRHEADQQRRDQQRQESPVVLHLPSPVHGCECREGGAGRAAGRGRGRAPARAGGDAPQPSARPPGRAGGGRHSAPLRPARLRASVPRRLRYCVFTRRVLPFLCIYVCVCV